VRDALLTACRQDLLFWLNTFAWILEPLTGDVKPFITWPFQDKVLLQLQSALGKKDVCITKSRGVGLSWMILSLFAWKWLFYPFCHFLLVSRNERMVYHKGDPDTLFEKIRFLIEGEAGMAGLPTWMRPDFDMLELRLKNERNGSTITGASTTGNVGRGGRRLAALFDEFAAFGRDDGYRALFATQAVTHCRIFNSTPMGTGNAFYDQAHNPNILQLRVSWQDRPDWSRGLYTSKNGQLVILDKTYPFKSDYPFILDGRVRSPWYDNEEARAQNRQIISQELDMDFLGSDFTFFDGNMLNRVEAKTRPPFLIGDLHCDPETGEPRKFVKHMKGCLRLWTNLDPVTQQPPHDRLYAIGVDVSAGTGASNSCISVGDARQRAKVASFVSPNILPYNLAVLCCALARWFAGPNGPEPMIIAECSGGHNRVFLKTLRELGYGNIYRRRSEEPGVTGKAEPRLGWLPTKDSRRELLEQYGLALNVGDLVNYDRHAIAECREYIFFPDGSVAHARSKNVLDPSGAKQNHGDRVIADALMWKVLKEELQTPVPAEEGIPPGSFAERMLNRRKEEARKRSLWED